MKPMKLNIQLFAAELTISSSVNSQSIANNTSSVKITCKIKRISGTTYWMHPYERNLTINCDGQTYVVATTLPQNTTEVTYSHDFTITHNTNGTKTINYSASMASTSSFPALSASGSRTLPTIPRYAAITSFNVSKRDETSVTFSWSADATCDWAWYSKDGGATWANLPSNNIVSGLSAGTTYNFKLRVRRTDSQLTTDSGVVSQTTYSYPYCNSMPDFTIGNQLKLGFYNPLGRSIQVNIIGFNGLQCSDDTISGTSITGYTGVGVVDNLYASMPNAQNAQYRVRVRCSAVGSDVTKYGGTYSINKTECIPEIGTVSYKDINSATVAVTSDNQLIIRNRSTVEYKATGLTTKKHSTISSCVVKVNNNNYTLSVSGSTATGGNAVIDSEMSVEAEFTLTDSRGLTITKSVEIDILDWVNPTAYLECARRNNYYSEVDVLVDAYYSSLDGHNAINIKARYKKSEDSTWGSYITLTDNVQTTFVLDNEYEWDIQFVITDLFGSLTINKTITRGMPIVFFDRHKNSVGFNCFPQQWDSVESNGVKIDIDEYWPDDKVLTDRTFMGEPVYRTTRCLGFDVGSGNMTHDIPNIDQVVDYDGFAYLSWGGACVALSKGTNWSQAISITKVDRTKIYYYMGSSYNENYIIYINIYYTKQ